MALCSNLGKTSKFLLKNAKVQYVTQYKAPGWNCINNYPGYMQMRGFSDCEPPAKCKVAIITGGSSGIGYHVAEHLLKAGAQAVIIGDINMDAMEEATCRLNLKYGENKALFQPCDVTKKEDMEKMFKCTKERFGRIDIVVNNAGILADSKWEQTLCINIHGLVRGTLLGFQYMGAQNCANGGLIINTSSILGLQPLYSSPVYVGTKHFIIGFSRSMGHDYFYKSSKVKVMVVCPGVTDTAMISEAAMKGMPGFGEMGKLLAKDLNSMPTQGPEEIGKAVIKMMKDGQNGSVWVSEGCDCYKVNIPDRSTLKPKDLKGCPPKDVCDPKKKIEDPCEKKEDPCKKKEDPCKKEKEDPCKKEKEDPCKKKEDPCKKEKEDPCKKEKEDPCQKKEDPCKKEKEDPCKKVKEDPCQKKEEDPCKKEKDPCKDEKDHSKNKKDSSKKIEDPSKKKDDHSKKKQDECEENTSKVDKKNAGIKENKKAKDSSKDLPKGKNKPTKK